jgi:hypothetical protein
MSSASNIVVDTGNINVTSGNITVGGLLTSGNLTSAGNITLNSGGDVILQMDTNDLVVQDTEAANGTNPRILFRDKNGTTYAGVKSGAANVIQILNGSSATDYAQLWAERIYPMNGSTASRYIYDDGTRTAFSGGIDVNGSSTLTSITLSSTLGVTGTATFSGSVTLGNSTSDDIIGTFVTNASTTNTYAIRWVYQGTAPTGILVSQIYAHTSSRKYKENIITIPDSDEIINVRPVSFQTKADIEAIGEGAPTQYGYIAEEMAENPVGMKFVNYNQDGSAEAVQYDMLAPAFASAMRAIRTRINQIEERLAELESAD